MQKLIITIFLSVVSFHLFAQTKADNILLKNYRPVSIYKTPTANIQKASFPVIDMHSHDYVDTKNDVDDLVKLMNKMNIKQMILARNKQY